MAGMRIVFLSGLLGVASLGQAAGVEESRISVERTAVAADAEVLTWFEQLPNGTQLPILSVLNDTLGLDPDDGRLRQVWVYTFERPSLAQRAESAVPFLYHRIRSQDSSEATLPRPVFDMGRPSKGIPAKVALATLQAEVINPAGAIARLTTRSYGGNLGEYKTTHVWEALDVISLSPENPDEKKRMLESRLQLNGRMFGGLVSDEALPGFYEKYQAGRTEVRGHNWELLRQSAEENGLYFQPISPGGMENSFALVWVAQADLPCGKNDHPARFDGQFLKFADPFSDESLCRWKGYTQAWDAEGSARGIMIPLALYSLDYPGVPLPLVDFRRAAGPTRSEMTLRFADDMTAGVLGLTGFGLTHLGYRAIKASWLFVHQRHGSATNRALRRRAFVQLRHALGTDDTLDPALRSILASRLEKLDLDPLERTWQQEQQAAWAQYNAFMKYAHDANGLARLLNTDREQEALAMAHGRAARALLRVASVSTFGLYRHDDLKPGTEERISQSRGKRAPAPRPAKQVIAEVRPDAQTRPGAAGE
jgi:hypothetical protein